MHKIIVVISSATVFALATFSASACPFDEHSASLKKDKVASVTTATTKTSEAMSTFSPKHPPLFEVVEEASEKPVVSKEITE